MKRLSFVVSITNNDNDYQQEQAAAAEKAGRRLGVDVKIIHANNDALAQSQQLLHYVQDSGVTRPDAIMFEPAGGTAFPQVARAAAAAGIGWVVLNHEVDYILELRRSFKVPVFAISSDHEEVGKIQGATICGAAAERRIHFVYRGTGEQFGGEGTNSGDAENQAGEYSGEDDARELDGRGRVSHGKFVAAVADVSGKPRRPGRSAGRQHGHGGQKSVWRNRRKRTGAVDEDSDHRLRWDA